jgi:hypothetical protein
MNIRKYILHAIAISTLLSIVQTVSAEAIWISTHNNDCTLVCAANGRDAVYLGDRPDDGSGYYPAYVCRMAEYNGSGDGGLGRIGGYQTPGLFSNLCESYYFVHRFNTFFDCLCDEAQ